jgi:hypothetical protein
MCWYLLGRHLSEIPGPEERVITTMMDEIVAESEYKYEKPIQRELLPIMIYRDMIRERWVWPGMCSKVIYQSHPSPDRSMHHLLNHVY